MDQSKIQYIDRQIAHQISEMSGLSVRKLGLRLDKVVIRLFSDLRGFVETKARTGHVVLVSVSAPIQLPAQTERELEIRILALLDSKNGSRDKIAIIYGNRVRLRLIENASTRAPSFIGLVHNSDVSAKMILDLATRWVSKS
jgi:hypothetical protein